MFEFIVWVGEPMEDLSAIENWLGFSLQVLAVPKGVLLVRQENLDCVVGALLDRGYTPSILSLRGYLEVSLGETVLPNDLVVATIVAGLDIAIVSVEKGLVKVVSNDLPRLFALIAPSYPNATIVGKA